MDKWPLLVHDKCCDLCGYRYSEPRRVDTRPGTAELICGFCGTHIKFVPESDLAHFEVIKHREDKKEKKHAEPKRRRDYIRKPTLARTDGKPGVIVPDACGFKR